jgi:hypothetical protein
VSDFSLSSFSPFFLFFSSSLSLSLLLIPLTHRQCRWKIPMPPHQLALFVDSLANDRFNVHGVIYLGDEEHIAPVEQAIRDLSSGLQMVKDEQAYLVVRERIHRNSTSLFLFYSFSPSLPIVCYHVLKDPHDVILSHPLS